MPPMILNPVVCKRVTLGGTPGVGGQPGRYLCQLDTDPPSPPGSFALVPLVRTLGMNFASVSQMPMLAGLIVRAAPPLLPNAPLNSPPPPGGLIAVPVQATHPMNYPLAISAAIFGFASLRGDAWRQDFSDDELLWEIRCAILAVTSATPGIGGLVGDGAGQLLPI